jgi:hypothetical protein
VDNFRGISLDWAYLGHESHGLDTMAHTPDDDGSLWRVERHHGGPILAIHHHNDLPLEDRALHLRA